MTGDWHGEPASSPPATCAAVLLGDAERRRAMGGRAVAEAARDGGRESESASLFFFSFPLRLRASACWGWEGAGRLHALEWAGVGRLGYATAYPGHPLGPPVLLCLPLY